MRNPSSEDYDKVSKEIEKKLKEAERNLNDRELALIADNRQQHKLAVKYSNRRFK